ncbi:dienelactone hydrolase family protein [Galbibacter sp. PAP.153]|uniref:dienelactone hydrolase family protein n=1 Tax=Galbibacter sp. PAP.153 TaxID=3104623 RepID=UPI00300BC8CF
MRPAQQVLPISYQCQDDKLNGFITSNKGQDLPAILILPAWLGIDDEAKNAALNLQAEGYMAFIADIYGEGNIPEDSEEASKTSKWYKQHFEHYQKRISVALTELIKAGANPHKIAVMGYCFGGTGALEAARGKLPVVGIICIHGSLYKDPRRNNDAFDAKVLIQHPADDHTVTKEDYENSILEMKESNADWQLITYGNSKHTFTNPKSSDYNKVMANRAWEHALQFLAEILK